MAFLPPNTRADYSPPFARTDYSPDADEHTIEDAVQGIEDIIRSSFPAILEQIMAERKDGIILEPIRSYEWEEVHNALKSTPCAIIIGEEELNPEATKERNYIAIVTVYIIVVDRSKTMLTRKLFRYGHALRRMLRPALGYTLHRVVSSATIRRIQYSPTFVDRDQLFARDLRADIECKIIRPC
jgi:hypothetical protein